MSSLYTLGHTFGSPYKNIFASYLSKKKEVFFFFLMSKKLNYIQRSCQRKRKYKGSYNLGLQIIYPPHSISSLSSQKESANGIFSIIILVHYTGMTTRNKIKNKMPMQQPCQDIRFYNSNQTIFWLKHKKKKLIELTICLEQSVYVIKLSHGAF